MPIFDYECPKCGTVNEMLITATDRQPRGMQCSACKALIDTSPAKRLPGAAAFKIKGMRAANGYGLKSIDTYGVDGVTGEESGYSFTGKGGTTDHNLKREE